MPTSLGEALPREMGEEPADRLFDQPAFARTIRVRIAELGIDARAAAVAIGCSESSLSRITKAGRNPDVENYLRIVRWLAQTIDQA